MTATLARNLRDLAEYIYRDMENGVPWSEIREDAKRLMEG